MLNFISKLRELPEDRRQSVALIGSIIATIVIVFPLVFIHGVGIPGVKENIADPPSLIQVDASVNDEFSSRLEALKKSYGIIADTAKEMQVAVTATTTATSTPARATTTLVVTAPTKIVSSTTPKVKTN